MKPHGSGHKVLRHMKPHGSGHKVLRLMKPHGSGHKRERERVKERERESERDRERVKEIERDKERDRERGEVSSCQLWLNSTSKRSKIEPQISTLAKFSNSLKN
ncbi:hypothetical protein FHG87_003061 [Trinorchestia longiramus]|nr:hypothetical protein FHG87_003061 [Trinorchestia longiramus]